MDVPDGDKIGHFLAYALLSVWSVWIFASRRNHLLSAVALVLLGIAMEIAQGAHEVPHETHRRRPRSPRAKLPRKSAPRWKPMNWKRSPISPGSVSFLIS